MAIQNTKIIKRSFDKIIDSSKRIVRTKKDIMGINKRNGNLIIFPKGSYLLVKNEQAEMLVELGMAENVFAEESFNNNNIWVN